MRKTFLFVLIPLPLLLLAAVVHPTQILRIPASSPAPDAISQRVPLTRIYRAPAVLIDTGLEIPDLITNLAFDPEGNLWLSSLEGGPYIYLIRVNELIDLVSLTPVSGLFPSTEGMWILTKEQAALYRGTEKIRQLRFPSGTVPLGGLQKGNDLLFATSAGIFQASSHDVEAHYSGTAERSYFIASHPRGLLISTDSGLKLWNAGGSKSFLSPNLIPKRGVFASVLSTPEGIFAGTDQDGFLHLSRSNWRRIIFARRNLNLNSLNASVVYQNNPWFGTLDGSVVFQSAGCWHWIGVSEFPVTALATNGKSLFAWSGGKLVEIAYDNKKSSISSSASAVREQRVDQAQQ